MRELIKNASYKSKKKIREHVHRAFDSISDSHPNTHNIVVHVWGRDNLQEFKHISKTGCSGAGHKRVQLLVSRSGLSPMVRPRLRYPSSKSPAPSPREDDPALAGPEVTHFARQKTQVGFGFALAPTIPRYVEPSVPT